VCSWLRTWATAKYSSNLISQCAITLLQASDHDDHGHTATLYHTFNLLHYEWEVQISHIYQDISNHVADHLANRGHSFSIDFHYIEQFNPSLLY
ncbi:hypothetical protein LINPERHAP1_LOCUS40713, partial [Linum perenne]